MDYKKALKFGAMVIVTVVVWKVVSKKLPLPEMLKL